MLKLTDIKQNLSPNFGSRGAKTPEIIILHCPVGTFDSAVATFKSAASKVSAHYVVDRDGSILQMVSLDHAAWHAMHYPNLIGIGIEMVDEYFYSGYKSRGCMGDPQWFTKPELDSVAELVAALMTKYNIPLTKVMGHNDPWLRQFGNNHQDPGPFFPWVQFKQSVQKILNFETALEKTNKTIDMSDTKWDDAPVPVTVPVAQTKLDVLLSMKTRKKRGKPLRKMNRNK